MGFVGQCGSKSEVGWRLKREKSEHNPKVAKVPKKWRKWRKFSKSDDGNTKCSPPVSWGDAGGRSGDPRSVWKQKRPEVAKGT